MFRDEERLGGGCRGEDVVRQSGSADCGVVVWGDNEGTRGLGVCAALEVGVFDRYGGGAIGGGEYTVYFCGE
jgi:hypothetical protein